MSKTTQDGRLLSIATPFAKDFLMLQKFSAAESISELFRIEVELVHEEPAIGFEATEVDSTQILGKRVAIGVNQPEETTRYFNGIVNSFSQGIRNTRFSFYNATIVPEIWYLTERVQSRIFQQISVSEILRKVLAGFDFKLELQTTYEPRNYCVQYRESDFDFISRLMEEEGIYYFFEHTAETHRMIIGDTPQSHRDCRPKKPEIQYFNRDDGGEYQENSILTWRSDHKLQSGKSSLWDFNFQLPKQKLSVSQETQFKIGNNQDFEIYDYPGGYARKYDGINKSGGDQPADLQKVYTDRNKTSKTLMQSRDAKVNTVSGLANCSAMTPGYRFTLEGHPNKKNNDQYVVVSLQHEVEQSPDYISNEEIGNPYENAFSCIKSGGSPPFRPPIKTPKPMVYGNQTAYVVGPSGEEIFTDKYGRVKVQFHWDRDGKVDANSSCWLRVTQSWAGNRWGMMFIPRIGMEVVVSFLEGDPDQPIIVGCVYNADAMPPYTLPDEKTKMTIKSDSSKGGGGFNELRFEDKKGNEQIFTHAEKDQDIRVKNDTKEIIKHDRHLIVENDQFERVKKDKHLKVIGDHNEKVDGTISINAGVDFEEKAGMKFAVDAGNEIHLKSGMTLTLETGTSLTLKVGGSFINLNPSGVYISGPMVFINSGGSAGSGSGSNPEPPTDPKEAVLADPGQKILLVSPGAPPARPEFQSAAAVVLTRAAEIGATFCEICSRQ